MNNLGKEVNGRRERRLLVFLSPELLRAVVKQLLIHLHEKLQSIVDEAMDGPACARTQTRKSAKKLAYN